MIMEHEYKTKPSVVTLMATIKKAITNGADFIILSWGENQITVELTEYGWIGLGWIGKNGGNDLVRKINL